MASTDLAAFGWTTALDEVFAPFTAAGLVPGRVVLEHNHVYRVVTAEGGLLAEAAGRIKYLATGRHELPAVGDWVGVRPDPRGGRSQIRTILPRRSWFSRKAAGRGTDEQVLAANIDTVFLVFGLDGLVNARSIERYLLVARRSGARPVVVLNKSDAASDPGADVAAVSRVAEGTPVYAVSTRIEGGLAPILSHLEAGQTVVLLGPSGVGKSSIVNALAGADVLTVGDVRAWDLRGRHTSVHRQLVATAGGALVIDTPGLRELQLWDTDDVSHSFEDIAELGSGCRFRDCLHDREPGCAVKAAVVEGRLDRGRYESFLKLQHEQEAIQRLRDERADLDAKRQGRIASKSMKTFQKRRGR
jgi:ribosome biogenesis GTPase / thiamine phosphate phosphatase